METKALDEDARQGSWVKNGIYLALVLVINCALFLSASYLVLVDLGFLIYEMSQLTKWFIRFFWCFHTPNFMPVMNKFLGFCFFWGYLFFPILYDRGIFRPLSLNCRVKIRFPLKELFQFIIFFWRWSFFLFLLFFFTHSYLSLLLTSRIFLHLTLCSFSISCILSVALIMVPWLV